jgi:putative nucleotidyltransferase with HDIG domain
MESKLSQFVNRIGDLPSVPVIAGTVIALVEDPNASADDLRAVVERDPALAARVLKVANSSLFGFSRRIETLRHAIALLGFRTVKNLVMGASMKEVFKRFGLTERLLWEHATRAGAVAAMLTEHPAIDVEREEAFVIGLLHDLGKIAINNSAPDEYSRVVAQVYNEGVGFVEAEREIFGFDHAEVGALVAAKWKLPPRLETAIRLHHSPEALPGLPIEDRRLTALATVTTALCTRLGVGRRAPVEGFDPRSLPAWSALGLSDEDLDPLLGLTSSIVKESEELFA